MFIFTRLILIVTILLFSQTAFCQPLAEKRFSLQEDNRAVTINCIFKGHNGFIYVGTNSGLFSFDGESFSKFYFKNKDYTDTVTAIAQDASHTIWAGFKSGRLAKLVNDQVTFFDPEEGTPSKRISAICFDVHNNLWYASYGEGIYYQLNNKQYLLNADNGIADLNINSLCATTSGEVLAATDQGLLVCSPANRSKITRSITPAQGLPDYIVTSISPAGNNRFWIGMQDKGFCLYDHSQQKILLVPAMKQWTYGEVTDILQDGNDLWIATQENGLIRFDIAANSFHLTKSATPQDVHQLIKDPQGNIWFSNHQNNLVNIKNNQLQVIPYAVNGVYDKIHALLFDSNGNAWFGEDQGVYQLDIKTGSIINRVAVPVDYATDITALYEDAFKNIWIGTMGKGLFTYDKKSGKLRPFPDAVLQNTSVLSLSGKGQVMYACTLQGAFSIQVTPAGYRVHRMNGGNASTHFIYNIFKDSKNRTWFATDGDGIWMQADNGSVLEFGEKDKLKDAHIYSIAEDKAGNIWFSTASSGVYKYDGGSFTNFGLQQGISDLYISVVKTLGSGNIAVVNKNGIDIIEPSTGRVSYLSSKIVGAINADNLGAVAIDDMGRILVAGERGIIAYDLPKDALAHPKTILRSVSVFGANIDTGKKVFNHDENNFQFDFIGLYYTDPAAVYYQYKLEGLDSNWINTMDRSQTFPKLEPGEYTFKVRSSLNKNFVNAQEASYQFTIKKAFYTTWWFFLVVAAVTGLILYGLIRNRERQFRKMQQLQHEKMQFRFEVLRNQVNPHFLFNSFNTLISTIEQDPKLAVEYTEQLSDFFRHIVSYRDKDTISLAEELDLLNTYFFLQQKRYGAALQMQVHVSQQQKENFQIPPLTLQLLLENAMKHNAVSKDSPLLVIISFVEPNWLTIVNAKSKRNILQPGAGLGLQNIRNRFLLLSNREVMIEDTETQFLIKLPLIPNDSI